MKWIAILQLGQIVYDAFAKQNPELNKVPVRDILEALKEILNSPATVHDTIVVDEAPALLSRSPNAKGEKRLRMT